MGFIESVQRQKAVWWPKEGEDSYGRPIYKRAVEIKCRWEDVHEQFMGADNTTRVSNARVMVDRDMKDGDLLWLGELNTLDNVLEPHKNEGVYEIQKFEKIPDFNPNKTPYRQAML